MVIVLIILGLLYQFSGAFKSYVGSYFGNYIACLIEVGDLPGVATTCDDQMPGFDLKNGKPLVTSVGGSGSSSGSTNGSSSSSTTSTTPSQTSANKVAASSSSSSGGGAGSGSASESASTTGGSSRNTNGGGGRRASTPVGSVGGTGNARGTEDDVVGISPTSTSVGRYHGEDRSRLNNMSWGYYGEEEQKEREKDKPTISAMKRDMAENAKLRPKSAKENLTRTIASDTTDDNADYTFGGLFRMLIIILMILAIVVFFGGQILQISKSGEK